MVHVPYRHQPPAFADVPAGQVQVMFGNMTASIEHIRSGGLRARAVTTAARSIALPNAPTVADTAPGYEATQLVAPLHLKSRWKDRVRLRPCPIGGELAHTYGITRGGRMRGRNWHRTFSNRSEPLSRNGSSAAGPCRDPIPRAPSEVCASVRDANLGPAEGD